MSGHQLVPRVEAIARDCATSSAPPLWCWALGWLIFVFYANAYFDLSFSLGLYAITPLAAAWAVRKFGRRAIAPLLVVALLPSLSIAAAAQLSVGVAQIAPAVLLLGIGIGVLYAPRRGVDAWPRVLHPSRNWMLLTAFALFLFARIESRAQPIGSEGLDINVDWVSGLGALLFVMSVNWPALAEWILGARSSRGRSLLRWAVPIFIVVEILLRFNLYIGPFSFGWGFARASALPAVLCLLAVLAQPSSWRKWMAVAAAVLAAEAVRQSFGIAPLYHLYQAAPARAESMLTLGGMFCDLASTVLLASTFASFVRSGVMLPSRPLWLALCAVVMLQFFAARFFVTANGAAFAGLSIWLVGGVAFAAAFMRGGLGLLAAPLALAVTSIAGQMLILPQSSTASTLNDGLGIAANASMFTFIGMLMRRSMGTAGAVASQRHRSSIDIGALSGFVNRLDTSATVRSFGALLAVLGVGAALLKIGVFEIAFASFGSSENVDAEFIVLSWFLLALFSLMPLAFVAIDSVQRKDQARDLAAINGVALASVCLAAGTACVCAFVYAPTAWFAESASATHLVQAFAIIEAILLWSLLVASSRRVLWVSAVLLTLATAIGVGTYTVLSYFGARSEPSSYSAPILTVLVTLIGLIATLALAVRSMQLRADLAGNIPRGLLFGQIAGRGFWARLACLMGMPSSMWNLPALRTPAFWALLAARPLVYAGAFALWQSHIVIGPLAIIAGHAAFVGGKRLAARDIWRVGVNDSKPPVLFLRSFEDDQFDLGTRSRNPWRRWIELWSFRRNIDEAMVDEVACYGRVVALGRPGETIRPFGASRYYSSHDDWQQIITDTACRAHSIVIVAGATPGVLWEYELLAREKLLDRTLLLFRPGDAAQAANQAALAAFPLDADQRESLGDAGSAHLVALLHIKGAPLLLTAAAPGPAAYLLALRAHFQRCEQLALVDAARAAPEQHRVRKFLASVGGGFGGGALRLT